MQQLVYFNQEKLNKLTIVKDDWYIDDNELSDYKIIKVISFINMHNHIRIKISKDNKTIGYQNEFMMFTLNEFIIYVRKINEILYKQLQSAMLLIQKEELYHIPYTNTTSNLYQLKHKLSKINSAIKKNEITLIHLLHINNSLMT